MKVVFSVMAVLSVVFLGCSRQVVQDEQIQSGSSSLPDLYSSNSSAAVRFTRTAQGGYLMQVKGQPFIIRGVSYGPAIIGESPHTATLRDWAEVDDNSNGTNDFAYETWVDENQNNLREAGETNTGDFAMLKDLGANAIRVYQVPTVNPLAGSLFKTDASARKQYDHALNKPLLRELATNYGVYSLMGTFFGAWTLGSGAEWANGTDYSDPAQRANMLNVIKAMVLENKDEPYVLMWVLGNENNFEWTKCNAASKPQAYASLLEEAARWIHSVDPDHPVAVCLGDQNGAELDAITQYAPSIDLIGYNSYRNITGGGGGFGSLWATAKTKCDRPVFLTEFGRFAWNNSTDTEDEVIQALSVTNCWADILANSAAVSPGGVSVGGVVFDWMDRWYLQGDDGTAQNLDNGSQKWHQEYFGLLRYPGTESLGRQKRQVYHALKAAWGW